MRSIDDSTQLLVREITGRTWFPRAKDSSEPYLHLKKDKPPVLDGTPISVWKGSPRQPNGYWVAKKANLEVWERACVWRIRKISQLQGTTNKDTALDRIAAALERVAFALEEMAK